MVRVRLIMILFLAATAFSGCIGTGEPVDVGAGVDPGIEGRDVGRIVGTVIDHELRPLSGALVALDELPPVTTDDTGRYHLNHVVVGSHRLVVQALGYMGVARSVDVAAGQEITVDFTLEPVPIQDPHVELFIFEGYDICSYAIFAFVGTAPDPCPFGESKSSFDFKMEDSWRYLVIEVAWESSESMWVSVNTRGAGCTTGNPCPGVNIGASPVRIEGAPGDMELAKRYSLDGESPFQEGAQELRVATLYAGLLREEINSTAPAACVLLWSQFGVAERLGCPLGFGYSLGTQFTDYVSIFHWEPPEAPARYTGLPDE